MKKLIATLFAALVSTSALAFDNSASFSDYSAHGAMSGAVERGTQFDIQGYQGDGA